MSQKILIDTDAGDDVDDMLAIAFALLRPELDIKAITTVSPGSARRAQLVRRLLHTVQCDDIPVAAGMELPLRALSTEEIQQMTQREYVLNHAPEDNTEFDDTDAISLLIRTVEQHPGEITVVTIGPLTNIACALQRKPEIAAKIRSIAMMGGEVHLPQKEHNLTWDYQASSIVFNSGIPLFMGTWSITRRFTLLPAECEQIKQRDTSLCRLLAECIDSWWPHKGGKPGPVMYDIAPLIWSYDPTCYPTEAMSIGIETRGEFTTGMTVRRDGPTNVEVSVDILAEEIKALYLETILSIDS
jgi:purine nucleosidase/pyrimidine-specific ribonucleoside hydrolase